MIIVRRPRQQPVLVPHKGPALVGSGRAGRAGVALLNRSDDDAPPWERETGETGETGSEELSFLTKAS